MRDCCAVKTQVMPKREKIKEKHHAEKIAIQLLQNTRVSQPVKCIMRRLNTSSMAEKST